MNLLFTLTLFIFLQILGIRLLDQFSKIFAKNKSSFHFFYLPIVFFHEIGHLVLAILLFQPIHSFSVSIFQKSDESVGSVTIKPTDSISSSLVAIGPLILSMTLIVICQIFVYPQVSGLLKMIYFIFLLFLTQVGVLSKQDWTVGAKGLFLTILISSIFFVFANNTEKSLLIKFLQKLSQNLNYIYLILCIINLTATISIKSISNANFHHLSSKN